MSWLCTTEGGCAPAMMFLAAFGGWAAVAAALSRGMAGDTRFAALTAHTLILVLVMLRGTVAGHGLLFMLVTATAAWWALLAVTRFRPERLLDPSSGGLVPLAGWFFLTGALAAAGYLAAG